MRKELTELVFILDKSGSMGGRETDTIGGYNSMLQKQKELDGQCNITTVLFNNYYELLHDRIDIRAVRPITQQEYRVGGQTALYDAVGKTIKKIDKVQRSSGELGAGRVMFVIDTDGMENASHEYSASDVKGLIQQQKAKHDWEFIFLGSNIDAVKSAYEIGIEADRAVDCDTSSEGTKVKYNHMATAVACCRANQPIDKTLDDLRQDTKRRKKAKDV